MIIETPERINLTPDQATMIHLLNSFVWVCTEDFRAAGIFTPARRIADLKAKGAQIEVELKNITVNGKFHPKVAHYRLIGWEDLKEQQA